MIGMKEVYSCPPKGENEFYLCLFIKQLISTSQTLHKSFEILKVLIHKYIN